MTFSKTLLSAAVAALTVQQSLAQGFTIGGSGANSFIAGDSSCPKGWLNRGHCCDGTVIGAGTDNAICCLNDSPVGTLTLVNADSSVGVSINGNGLNINNEQGASTCTGGTSTAFTALPSTPVGGSGVVTGPVTTTSVNASGQTCVVVTDGGSQDVSCSGSGNGGSSGAGSGAGSGITTSVSSSNGPSATSQTTTPTSPGAGNMVVATAAPILAGAMMGLAAML